ncbi:hypothetical protein BKA70DRAFT_1568422 [Coprinopsis sp. MPI-PUGE-AT-0042]|nr:hypothetical protein BKA70DRAFT_1568422 [Coprinopsis sp. MPI-PUGE-AT-0042]
MQTSFSLRLTSLIAVALASITCAAANPTIAKRTCGDRKDAVPLLRAYNPIIGDHFYTTNAAERDNAVAVLGYVAEGVTGYLFPKPELHTVPLYRTYHLVLTDHFYTTNAVEKDAAIRQLGYFDEGIVGYVYPDTECGGHPLFRAYSAALGNHFYTMGQSEWENSVGLGYAQEGIAGYLFAA